MGSRVRMSPTERREQIIDEATRIIGRGGYYGFSINEVAEKCGITVAGLLYHVESKENLLVMVLHERDRRDLSALGVDEGSTRSIQPPASLDQALSSVRRVVTRNSKQPEIVRLYAVLHSESLDSSHPAYEFFRERDLMSIEMLYRLFSPFVEDSVSFAHQAFALMGGLEEQWLRNPGDFDLVEQWDRGISSLLYGSRKGTDSLVPPAE